MLTEEVFGEREENLYWCIYITLVFVIRVLLEACEKVLMRLEKDVVTSNENCYQKDAELCGPRNCKVMEKLAITILATITRHYE